MTRLDEAFARREYESCGIQVTRNIARLWATRFNLSLEKGGKKESTRYGLRRMINDGLAAARPVRRERRGTFESSRLPGDPAQVSFVSRIVWDGLKEISTVDMRFRRCRIN